MEARQRIDLPVQAAWDEVRVGLERDLSSRLHSSVSGRHAWLTATRVPADVYAGTKAEEVLREALSAERPCDGEAAATPARTRSAISRRRSTPPSDERRSQLRCH